jgi:mannose-6-phosphate isomerase-like protein (cupin superfamily)
MLIRKLHNCEEIVAGDHVRLRELLHPDRDYQFNGRYSLAHAVLAAGEKSARHRLATNEVYYVLSGTGLVHVDDESARVVAGDVVEIPPGSIQWIENIAHEELAFLCIVDPAWRAADEEVLD